MLKLPWQPLISMELESAVSAEIWVRCGFGRVWLYKVHVGVWWRFGKVWLVRDDYSNTASDKKRLLVSILFLFLFF